VGSSMLNFKQNVKFITDDEFARLSEEEKLALIQPELDLIKTSFSQDQIDMLSTYLVDGDSHVNCIYGLMTGHCNSLQTVNFISELPVLISNCPEEIKDLYIDDNDRVYHRTVTFRTPLEEYIIPDDEQRIQANEDGEYPIEYYNMINDIIKQIKE
jgi:hypothetical protein